MFPRLVLILLPKPSIHFTIVKICWKFNEGPWKCKKIKQKRNFLTWLNFFFFALKDYFSDLRHSYLFEGPVTICRTTQPIELPANGSVQKLKQFIFQTKHKVSKRYAYLFEGQIILVKNHQQTFTSSYQNSSTSASSKPKSKFKQRIMLDKCHLIDRDDECCFELKIFNNNSVSSSTFAFYQQQNQQQANKSDSQASGLNSQQQRSLQNKEYILFILDHPNDKYQWMPMLCYTQYKFTIDRLLQTMTEEHNKNNPLPIPPKDYPFDQPDSPETILFELPHQQLDLKHNPYLTSSDGLLIKAATLTKLVERLTHHLYLHPKFSNTFLMFFREFTTTKEFLSLLSQRYDVPDLNMSEIESKYDFVR